MPDSFTPDELRRLLTAAKLESVRNWLMLLIAYWHGLRVSEVLALTPKNFKDSHLTVKRGKKSLKTRQRLIDHRDVLLNEAQAVARYLRQLRPSQKLFPISLRTADRLIKRYAKAAQIPEHKAHMHTLKHSAGMHFIDKMGIEHVRQHLGHKSIRSTQIYARVTDEQADEALKRAIQS